MSSESLIGIAVNIIGGIIAFFGFLYKVRQTISEEIENHRDKVEDDISSLRSGFGETVTAIRSKINEVELFTRDTFVRRDEFYQAMQSHSSDMRNQFEKIEARLERMEIKIDSGRAV